MKYEISKRYDTYAKGMAVFRDKAFTFRQNVEARLIDLKKNNDRKLFETWQDSCTAVVYPKNFNETGEFIIVPKCELLINIDENFNSSFLPITDEQYNQMKKEKGAVVLNIKDAEYDDLLSLNEVKSHPAWIAACEGDTKLLSNYAENYFKLFNKSEAMGFYLDGCDGKNGVRAVVLYNVNSNYSNADGDNNLNNYGRFVSSSPTEEELKKTEEELKKTENQLVINFIKSEIERKQKEIDKLNRALEVLR